MFSLLIQSPQFLSSAFGLKIPSVENHIATLSPSTPDSKIIDFFYQQYLVSSWLGNIPAKCAVITVSLSFAALVLTWIDSYRTSKSRKSFYDYLFSEKTISYEELKQMAYQGGNSIEDLIITQPCLLQIIKDAEKGGKIPQPITLKNRFNNTKTNYKKK